MYIKTQINYAQNAQPTHEFEIVKIHKVSDIVIELWDLKISKKTHKLICYNNIKVFLLAQTSLSHNIALIPAKYEKDIVFIDKFAFSIEANFLFLRDIKLLKEFIAYLLNKTNIQVICYDNQNIKLYIPMEKNQMLEIIILSNKSIKIQITDNIDDFNIIIDLSTIIKMQIQGNQIILDKISNKKIISSLRIHK